MYATRVRLAAIKSALSRKSLKGREISNKPGSNFDTNFPSPRKAKAWDGQDREKYFKDKFAHIHAKQKKSDSYRSVKQIQREADIARSRESQKKQKSVVARLKPVNHTEYVYGTSAVEAALRNPSREAGHSELFIMKGIQKESSKIVKLAKELKLPIDREMGRNDLNRWTNDGVHNGYALKTRPLKLQSIQCLGVIEDLVAAVEDDVETVVEDTSKYNSETTSTANELSKPTPDEISEQVQEPTTAAAAAAVEVETEVKAEAKVEVEVEAEDEALDEIEFFDEEDLSANTPLSYKVHQFNNITNQLEVVEYPVISPSTKTNALGIYIDQVTDPHNLGAIIRSAHFLGADFAVVSELNCAKFTPVAAKSSSGAIDSFRIFSCDAPLKLFEKSAANGWNIIATVTPSVNLPHAKRVRPRELALLGLGFEKFKRGPCLLAVGSESEGLRTSLLNRCTHVVSIPKAIDTSRTIDVVDSLNVSVATALLISNFMLE